MKLTFRAATPSDQEEWIAMRYELWPDCPLERHRLEVEQLLSSDGVVVIAQAGEALVGFAEISIRSDHVDGTSIAPVPYLEGWYVRPAHRAKGVGAGLMKFVEQWAIERDFSELASDAELENVLSIQLHGKLGFREVGRSVHFVKKLETDVALQKSRTKRRR